MQLLMATETHGHESPGLWDRCKTDQWTIFRQVKNNPHIPSVSSDTVFFLYAMVVVSSLSLFWNNSNAQ